MSTVHNPTNFEPSDYDVIGYLDNQRPRQYWNSAADWQDEVKSWEQQRVALFGINFGQHIHHCIHCGNGSVRWITAVRHRPTNEVVVFGAICTARLGFNDQFQFQLAQLQARAKAAEARWERWNKSQAFLSAHPEIATALQDITLPIHAANTFAQDVLKKLDQYGELSPKQTAAVLASMERDRTYLARKAAEAAEVKGPAPNGRVNVTGLVLSVKEQMGHYGFTIKMLVKLVNNSKVWCSVPSGSDIGRGDTVTLCATWTVSPTDVTFAFGKRPMLISRVAA